MTESNLHPSAALGAPVRAEGRDLVLPVRAEDNASVEWLHGVAAGASPVDVGADENASNSLNLWCGLSSGSLRKAGESGALTSSGIGLGVALDDWSGVPMGGRVVPSQPCAYFPSVSALMEGEAEVRAAAAPRMSSGIDFIATMRGTMEIRV